MPTQQIDMALTDSYDMQIANGDFVMEESTQQHQVQLLLNDKGDFKENPTICVGVLNYMDDEDSNELIRDMTIEYVRDGMSVKSVKIINDKIVIDADYA